MQQIRKELLYGRCAVVSAPEKKHHDWKVLRERAIETPALKIPECSCWKRRLLFLTISDMKTVPRSWQIKKSQGSASPVPLLHWMSPFRWKHWNGTRRLLFSFQVSCSTGDCSWYDWNQSDVLIITAGNKVGQSEAALLNMLNISFYPWIVHLVCLWQWNHVLPSNFESFTSDASLLVALKTWNLTLLLSSLETPTVVSIPHLLING
jgi:hypothetical protein